MYGSPNESSEEDDSHVENLLQIALNDSKSTKSETEEKVIMSFSDLSKIETTTTVHTTTKRTESVVTRSTVRACYEVSSIEKDDLANMNIIPTDAFDMEDFSSILSNKLIHLSYSSCSCT